jgi:predicted nucleic-acid-binding Zn-ribbon protein
MEVDYLKAIDWIRRNWTQPTECPVCGNDNWVIGDQIVEMRSSSGTAVYPQFFVLCLKCAHTVFFNAVVAGLIAPKPPLGP